MGFQERIRSKIIRIHQSRRGNQRERYGNNQKKGLFGERNENEEEE